MVNFHFPIITAMVSTSVCQFEQQAKFRDIWFGATTGMFESMFDI